ncbi:MAG TPA: ABC transporter permease [Verrucomicrobia bacterium]|nr:MAG: ABC transporter permease [Lentisphaerae bacterium GWF2_57_35]HBA85651.1 ABC transporter permease [Verrucomicrobiota bacterium]
MTLLLGSLTIGLILTLLALGVYISFRIFDFPDLTADGSLALGAAVSAVLLVQGLHPVWATLAGAAAGVLAGAVTGLLHTRFRINNLLSGILVMTALYSTNLYVMGRSNVPLLSVRSLNSLAEAAGVDFFGRADISLFGWPVMVRDLTMLGCIAAVVLAACGSLYLFFRTQVGTAMRATGENPLMIRALGVPTGWMIVVGLMLSNGLIALSGSLLAQYQGFADVQMGIGMMVWGLASVIIGEALVQSRKLGLTIVGCVMGSVLFRLLIAIALRWGLNPNSLKLITAVFVLAALVLPSLIGQWTRRKGRA